MAQYILHTLPLLKTAKPKKNSNTIILFGDNDHTVIVHLKKRLCSVRVSHCSFGLCNFVLALELNRLEHFEISCWSNVSIHEVYQILFEVCLSNTISSITVKSQNIPADVDILGLCLDYLKNLKVLTLSQCFLTSGEEISNNLHTKNNLKKLKLEKCQIYEGHLEKLVNLFPFVEEFEMKNCNENHNLHYASENLMTHLKIISGFKNVRKFRLLHLYCQAEHDSNPDETIKKEVENSLSFINQTFSLTETEISVTILGNPYFGDCQCRRCLYKHYSNNKDTVSVVSEITKKCGTEATVKNFVPTNINTKYISGYAHSWS